ncbi:MAG: helix-turn-helix domain-containing protein [Undibacterium sp.]|nr:helix-turn-helix domain-containing protein [Opitutaceae bacterium]
MQSVAEMKSIRAGRLAPTRQVDLTPKHPRAIRAQLGYTQEEFAALLGVGLGTVRHWEQGDRQPTGAAKALLRVAARHPSVVRESLAQA